MIFVVILNVVIFILWLRAIYMARVYSIEYAAMENPTPVECNLVKENLEGWKWTVLAKSFFLVGSLIVLIYADFANEPFEATDLVVPIFILGFAVHVIREERRARTSNRRRQMLNEQNGQSDVSERLGRMEESDEDRYAEEELEKSEVRNRLVTAAREQNDKLNEHSAMLQEILGLLRNPEEESTYVD